MSTIKSFADLIMDWEKLLAAYAANAGSLAAMEPLRLEFAALRDRVLELKNQQAIQISEKQLTTQDIKVRLRAGREMARRLRGHAKAVLGTYNELLVAFQVTPLRDRRTRRGEPPVPPASTTPPPEEPPPPVE